MRKISLIIIINDLIYTNNIPLKQNNCNSFKEIFSRKFFKKIKRKIVKKVPKTV